MSWTSALTDDTAIQNIYKGNPPELRAVRLHEIAVSSEGPLLTVRFDLPEYPAAPTAKWKINGFNTVQVVLTLAGVSRISLDGFATNLVVDMEFPAIDAGAVEFCINSDDVNLQASAVAVSIAKVSAYLNDIGVAT